MSDSLVNNPFAGREAYASARYPTAYQEASCQLRSGECCETVDEPVEEVLDLPDCLRMVWSTDEDESWTQEYTLDAGSQSYTAPNGDTLSYNDALGFSLNTFLRNYSHTNNDVGSATGVYCSVDGFTAVMVDCAKASIPEEPAPDCALVHFADNASIVLGELNNAGGIYVGTSVASGMLTYTAAGVWEFTDGAGVIYTGSTEENQPQGLYKNADGECLIIKDCTDA